jgi:hypothetical protein
MAHIVVGSSLLTMPGFSVWALAIILCWDELQDDLCTPRILDFLFGILRHWARRDDLVGTRLTLNSLNIAASCGFQVEPGQGRSPNLRMLALEMIKSSEEREEGRAQTILLEGLSAWPHAIRHQGGFLASERRDKHQAVLES